jgi:hypothetical protein
MAPSQSDLSFSASRIHMQAISCRFWITIVIHFCYDTNRSLCSSICFYQDDLYLMCNFQRQWRLPVAVVYHFGIVLNVWGFPLYRVTMVLLAYSLFLEKWPISNDYHPVPDKYRSWIVSTRFPWLLRVSVRCDKLMMFHVECCWYWQPYMVWRRSNLWNVLSVM